MFKSEMFYIFILLLQHTQFALKITHFELLFTKKKTTYRLILSQLIVP